jgi:pyrroloquinoline quinone biosynthesis protein E
VGSAPEIGRILVLEVTPNCNNACGHCYNSWRGDAGDRKLERPLPASALCSLVARISEEGKVGQVALSGGEPFLRTDLPEIVRGLTDLGIHTTIITNGTLIRDRILRQLPPETVFEITLFSPDPLIHDEMAGRPCFEAVVDTLLRLGRQERPFVISCVLTRRNVRDTANTMKLALALGAQAVLLNRVNLARRTLARADELAPTGAELAASLKEANELAGRLGVTVAVSVPIPPCVVDVSRYQHLQFGWCPRGGARAYYTVTWDGTLRPCNHSSVVLGDLRKASFSHLVETRACRDYWAPLPQECRSCQHPLRDVCRGGCPAAAHECYGTTTRLDPFVELRGNYGTPPLCRSTKALGSDPLPINPSSRLLPEASNEPSFKTIARVGLD